MSQTRRALLAVALWSLLSCGCQGGRSWGVGGSGADPGDGDVGAGVAGGSPGSGDAPAKTPETPTPDSQGNEGPDANPDPEDVGDPADDPTEAEDTCLEPDDADCAADAPEDAPPASPFSDYDDFAEDNIIWLHTDVSGWDVTSTVTGAHITYDQLCVFHTMAGLWPEVYGIFPEAPEDPMEGNIWIIARVDGLWYAATFDYLRPGGECKYDGYAPEDEGLGPSTFGAAPLSTWVPQSGEPVYMFMSTVARHEPLGPLQERSDYVRLTWP